MRPPRLFLALLCCLSAWLGFAAPAAARLGGTPDQLANSPLVEGDTLFRFDGCVGSRYRFSAARNCRFGAGLFVALLSAKVRAQGRSGSICRHSR